MSSDRNIDVQIDRLKMIKQQANRTFMINIPHREVLDKDGPTGTKIKQPRTSTLNKSIHTSQRESLINIDPIQTHINRKKLTGRSLNDKEVFKANQKPKIYDHRKTYMAKTNAFWLQPVNEVKGE